MKLKNIGEKVQGKLRELADENKKITPEEIIIDKVINKFRNYRSSEISNYMHKEKAYKETKDNDIIPFSFANELNQF